MPESRSESQAALLRRLDAAPIKAEVTFNGETYRKVERSYDRYPTAWVRLYTGYSGRVSESWRRTSKTEMAYYMYWRGYSLSVPNNVIRNLDAYAVA